LTGARPAGAQISDLDIAQALDPLTNYFNENFAILNTTLTQSAMIMVMSKLWKEVLVTLESLLVPTLSDKPSQQRQLTQQEVDIVFKWLNVGLHYSLFGVLVIILMLWGRSCTTSSTLKTKSPVKAPASQLISSAPPNSMNSNPSTSSTSTQQRTYAAPPSVWQALPSPTNKHLDNASPAPQVASLASLEVVAQRDQSLFYIQGIWEP